MDTPHPERYVIGGDADVDVTMGCRDCGWERRWDGWANAPTLTHLLAAALEHDVEAHTPAPPTCRACSHRQAEHGLFGCIHRQRAGDYSSAMCPCPAMFGGDVGRIAGAGPVAGAYTVEDAMQILQALGKRGLVE